MATWRRFSHKSPKDNSEVIIRGELHCSKVVQGRTSFSTKTLWLDGNLVLDKDYYFWLDEEDDPECAKKLNAVREILK